MNKKAIALLMAALFLVTFAAGCVSSNPVKSQEDVQESVTEISGSIENVQTTLEDIDRKIG